MALRRARPPITPPTIAAMGVEGFGAGCGGGGSGRVERGRLEVDELDVDMSGVVVVVRITCASVHCKLKVSSMRIFGRVTFRRRLIYHVTNIYIATTPVARQRGGVRNISEPQIGTASRRDSAEYVCYWQTSDKE